MDFNTIFKEINILTRKYHLRGTWVATVLNLDWPSKQSLTIQNQAERIEVQKNELIRILDELVNMRMNSVFFQVKPTSDAFYQSSILPQSSYLTGKLGQNAGYDPLEFAVEQAHKRNIEIHAWFNPYRVSMDTSQASIDAFKDVPTSSPPSVYISHPEWIKVSYNRFVIDPGIPAARSWVIDGIMEVVKKYDIDGVHLDDYFYYESDDSRLDDNKTFDTYRGDFTNKGDWRRNNTLLLISELSYNIRSIKPYIKFGISPSGVWRNKGDDPLGSDTEVTNPHYDTSYIDTRLWIIKELIDYIAPQIYWSFTRKVARFDIIAEWWSNLVQDKNVHLYIGKAMYKVGVPSNVEPEWTVDSGISEIKKQLVWNIEHKTIQGNILFKHSSLHEQVALPAVKVIQQEIWTNISLIPSMPWKGTTSPAAPICLVQTITPVGIKLQWEDGNDASKTTTVYYAIYKFSDKETTNKLTTEKDLQDDTNNLLATVRYDQTNKQQHWMDTSTTDNNARYRVTALDRNHNESNFCILKLK